MFLVVGLGVISKPDFKVESESELKEILVPEELYLQLSRLAKAKGQTVEDFVSELLLAR